MLRLKYNPISYVSIYQKMEEEEEEENGEKLKTVTQQCHYIIVKCMSVVWYSLVLRHAFRCCRICCFIYMEFFLSFVFFCSSLLFVFDLFSFIDVFDVNTTKWVRRRERKEEKRKRLVYLAFRSIQPVYEVSMRSIPVWKNRRYQDKVTGIQIDNASLENLKRMEFK